ncbi:MAG: VWA domain-containing protein [Candidatus Koribacter versatilis]|uniref:VWA domain-containing protein n=1 Tax=Candidatus Korobacter versatilis TaxID=658062 RepID=A0A932A968_9BACT|nr:VWA domain-containing protein [Candidatus Koribacter versatilis]
MEVPVVVLDTHGKPVVGLKRDDFELLQDRDKQNLAVFEEIRTTKERVQYRPGAPGVYDNQVIGSAAGKRLTIIVLDTLNTAFPDQAYARSELIKYLSREVIQDEPVALLTISSGGTRVLHDFTEDPKVLIAVLKRFDGKLPMSEVVGASLYQSLYQNLEFQHQVATLPTRIDATLQALQHISQAFAAIPGRKSLIWISGGIPFQTEEPVGLNRFGGRNWEPTTTRDFRLLYSQTFQALNQANVAVYPVDPRGVTGTHNIAYSNPRAGMQVLADMTGGRFFSENNDLSGLFQKAADDCADYYMLAYYLPADLKPGWHELKVKVTGSGRAARARNGFFTVAPPKGEKEVAERRRLEIDMALVSPLNYTSLPIAVRWLGAPSGSGASKTARFQISVAPSGIFADESQNNAMNLEFVAVVRDGRGKDVDHFGQHIEGNLKPAILTRLRQEGLNYNNAVVVTPGDYQVRFVVRDNLTGRTGSVLAPLKVQ